MSLRIYSLIAAAVLVGVVYFKGHSDGKEALRAQQRIAIEKLEAELSEANARARSRARELIQAEEKAHALANDLENAARAAPGADRTALPRDSVRRVFSR